MALGRGDGIQSIEAFEERGLPLIGDAFALVLDVKGPIVLAVLLPGI